MINRNEEFKCCICGQTSIGFGNNPAPVKNNGRCCDVCNLTVVIPARIIASETEEAKPDIDLP